MESRGHGWGWPWLLLALVLLAAGFSVAHCLIRTRPGVVSEYNYGRVREGMTMEEVRALLGEPDNHIVTFSHGQSHPPPDETPRVWTCRYWTANGVEVSVTFLADGRPHRDGHVVDKHIEGSWDGR
jgi:hypothetical protein